jgi:hypothetical protein
MFFDRKRQGELMSVPTKEKASKFLAPIRGSLAIFLLHDIQAKMDLSRFVLRCARHQSLNITVLDVDAFYCTNVDRLAEDAKPIVDAELLLLPENDLEVGSLLPLLSSQRMLVVIDDLNSLYSLATDVRGSHQLSIMMKLLSYNARMNDSWVIATAYRMELRAKEGKTNQRSLTALGDLVVDADSRDGSLRLRGRSSGLWPNDELEI